MHYQILSLIIAWLRLSLLEVESRIVWRDDANGAEVWHWYLICRVECHRHRLIQIHLIMNGHLLFYILEDIILWSLIEIIYHTIRLNVHLLIWIVHHLRIVILVNKLRLLYHLLLMHVHWLWYKR